MSTDSHDKDHDHDRSYENESTRDHTSYGADIIKRV